MSSDVDLGFYDGKYEDDIEIIQLVKSINYCGKMSPRLKKELLVSFDCYL